MGYLDYSDADIIALTRQRRAEAKARPPVVRFSVKGAEFKPAIEVFNVTTRRKTAAKAWRIAQWQSGNRHCYYCEIRMLPVPKKGLPGPLCVTVDHKEPLILGGDDAAWNWVLACWQCNNDKGALTEAEFRQVMANAIQDAELPRGSLR